VRGANIQKIRCRRTGTRVSASDSLNGALASATIVVGNHENLTATRTNTCRVGTRAYNKRGSEAIPVKRGRNCQKGGAIASGPLRPGAHLAINYKTGSVEVRGDSKSLERIVPSQGALQTWLSTMLGSQAVPPLDGATTTERERVFVPSAVGISPLIQQIVEQRSYRN